MRRSHWIPAKHRKGEDLEGILASQMRLAGLPEPVREYRFARESLGRQWRFDFAWVDHLVAVEVEGATYADGRHTRGSGFAADCEKYNAAARLGWRVLRYDGNMVKRGEALGDIEAALGTFKTGA